MNSIALHLSTRPPQHLPMKPKFSPLIFKVSKWFSEHHFKMMAGIHTNHDSWKEKRSFPMKGFESQLGVWFTGSHWPHCNRIYLCIMGFLVYPEATLSIDIWGHDSVCYNWIPEVIRDSVRTFLPRSIFTKMTYCNCVQWLCNKKG